MKFLKNSFHHTFSRPVLYFIGVATILAGFMYVIAPKAAFADDPSATNSQRLVTIHDNGNEITIVTRALTIADALKEAEVTVSARDIIEPSLSETLVAKSYQVNVFRARPVVVADGSKEIRVMTAEQSPRQIAKTAGVTLYDEDTTQFKRVDSVLDGGGAGVKMIIDRALVFNFTLYGKQFTARTQATTVDELLKEKNITLGSADGVSPSQTTPLTEGMDVKVWRNGKQTITVEEVIVKPIEEVKDTSLDIGIRQVKTGGVDGKKNVTYEIETKDGVEISRTVIASVTTLEPIKEVVTVGAKYKGSYTTPSENQTITWNFLLAQGFSREQTAGIMGNLMQEHGFQTTGDGLAQWTGGRKAALMARPDPYNINTQLQFLMDELNTGYRPAKNAILAATTVDDAVRAFQNLYERCGICVESRRIQYAYNILASF